MNNLSPTDVTGLNVDLGTFGNPNPDGAADTVEVAGTDNPDPFVISGDTSAVTTTGIPTTVTLRRQDPALDRLILNGGAGTDTFDISGLQVGAILTTFNP